MVMVEVMVVRLCPARVGMPCRGADILQLDQYRDAQLLRTRISTKAASAGIFRG
jgi:hypothetical protein